MNVSLPYEIGTILKTVEADKVHQEQIFKLYQNYAMIQTQDYLLLLILKNWRKNGLFMTVVVKLK